MAEMSCSDIFQLKMWLVFFFILMSQLIYTKEKVKIIKKVTIKAKLSSGAWGMSAPRFLL